MSMRNEIDTLLYKEYLSLNDLHSLTEIMEKLKEKPTEVQPLFQQRDFNNSLYRCGLRIKNKNDHHFAIKHNTAENEEKNRKSSLFMYGINDRPNFVLCILLGLQHFMTMFGSTIAIPFLLAPLLCIASNSLALSDIISTVFFISGVATLVQVSVGIRLPIIQGATFAFLGPTLVILESKNIECVTKTQNNTDVDNWKLTMREIQGAIISASFIQFFLGFTGLIGILMRFISPLTVASTISLLGIGLIQSVGNYAGQSWLLASINISQITLFSQILGRKVKLFKLFPVVLSISSTWCLSLVLQYYDVIATSEKSIRTRNVMFEADWFRIPRPFQWGMPIFKLSSFLGMISAVFASILESIGNYHACARIASVQPPPNHAINRGIALEGILCILAGIWGSGNGTTSYSENIATIGVTRVASRHVIVFSAIIMLTLSIFPKFSAGISVMPEPIIGGMLWILFGMLLSVGLSMLQYVDFNSTRNMFVLGFTMYSGILVPNWIKSNKDAINTGISELDNVLFILLSTHMSIGGMTSIFLDNLIPGSHQERGLYAWKKDNSTSLSQKRRYLNKTKEYLSAYTQKSTNSIYDLPYIQDYLNTTKWAKFVPFLPYTSSREDKDNLYSTLYENEYSTYV